MSEASWNVTTPLNLCRGTVCKSSNITCGCTLPGILLSGHGMYLLDQLIIKSSSAKAALKYWAIFIWKFVHPQLLHLESNHWYHSILHR